MTAPSALRVLAAVKSSGVPYTLMPGWDDPRLAARQGEWDPSYVILHHTANGGAKGNAPSLAFCVRGTYPPIRNCHFLVGRDGHVFVVYALACYHAGLGGPGSWGTGPKVASGDMNRHAYGIEIESKGTSPDTKADGGTNGLTDAQLKATAKLSAALLDLLGQAPENAINHRTWAPGRKSDTLLADSEWHRRIRASRSQGGAGAGVPVPPVVKPAPARWTRDLVLHSTGTDVTYLLSTIRPEGLTQLSQALNKGTVPLLDQATWARIRTVQSHHPSMWAERVRRVVGKNTWRGITGHA